jgi:hypothetical protein
MASLDNDFNIASVLLLLLDRPVIIVNQFPVNGYLYLQSWIVARLSILANSKITNSTATLYKLLITRSWGDLQQRR